MTLYRGTWRLLAYGDTHAGRKATFSLPDDTDFHPFKGLRAGPTHGALLTVTVEGIDEGTPSAPTPLADQAIRYCQYDRDFVLFLAVDGVDEAIEAVRLECGVDRLHDIDRKERAAERWVKLRDRYEEQRWGGSRR